MFKAALKEQLTIPANIDYLGDLRDFVTLVGKKYHYSDKLINSFKLAIDEAATNIIKHAYREPDNYITIKAIVKRNSLTIVLIDQGTFFDPNWAKDPDIKKNIDIGQKASLGIFLMRRLMDNIDYRKTENGNELRLTKYRTPDALKDSAGFLGLHFSLEMKHTLIACGLLTAIVLSVFSYFYNNVHDRLNEDFIASGTTISNQIAKQIDAVKPELLNGSEGVDYLNAIILPVYDEKFGEIFSLSIEDTSGLIVWSTLKGDLTARFQRPESARQLMDKVFEYDATNGIPVYEFTESLNRVQLLTVYAKIHVMLLKDSVNSQIRNKRLSYLKTMFGVLALSYLVLFVLSYILTKPVRNLSRLMKDATKDNFLDDVDIDDSSEIGEIARAFSNMSEKLHQSEKSLATQEYINKEIQIAKEIQRSLLPNEIPGADDYEIVTHYEAAKSVGGDYYDFFRVDQDTIGIVVADVSGKGVPGSMVMTMIRTALRTEARGIKDAAQVLTKVNEFMVNDVKNGMFITVFYMILDTRMHTLNFASAGHTPMILHRDSTGKTFFLNPVGYPIGIQLPDPELFAKNIECETIQLLAEDTLLLYTDGITEAMNPQKELFGEDRLVKTIEKSSKANLQLVGDKLKATIGAFTGGVPQNDDITFVLIRQIKESDEDAVENNEHLSVESKFLSNKEMNYVFDIIKQNPVYSPAEICKKLKLAKYKRTIVSEKKLIAELRRKRLDTVQLRQEYVDICTNSKRKKKSPGIEKETKLSSAQKNTPKEKDPKSKQKSLLKGRKRPKTLKIKKPKLNESFLNKSGKSKEEEEYLDKISPYIESDYIVGEYIFDSMKWQHRDTDETNILEPETDQINLDNPTDKTAEIENVAHEFEIQDISDKLIDSLLEKHLSETAEINPETEEPSGVTTNDESMTAFEPTGVTPAQSKTGAAHSNRIDSQSEVLSEQRKESIQDAVKFLEQEFKTERSPEILSGEEQIDDSETSDKTVLEPKPIERIEKTEPTPPLKDESHEKGLPHWLLAGVRAYKEKDYATAISAFKKVIELNPEYEDVYELLGNAHFRNKQLKQALHIYEKAKLQFSPSATIHENLGLIYAKSGVFSLALREWKALLALQPERTDISKKINRLEKALDATQHMSMNSVKKASKSALTPQQALFRNGLIHYRKKRFNEALQVFEILVQAFPDFPDAQKLLGNLYIRFNRLEEAYRIFVRLKKNDHSASEAIALIYAKQGFFDKAVYEWNKILHQHPQREDLRKKIENISQLV